MGGIKEEKNNEMKINIEELKPSKEIKKIRLVMFAKRFKPLRDLLFWVWNNKDKYITSLDLAEGLKIRKIYALDKLNYLETVGILEKFGTRPKVFKVSDEELLKGVIEELDESD